MLFFNKLSVSDQHEAEYKLLPGPISCIQLTFATAFCLFLRVSGIERYEDIRDRHTLRMYSLYCVLFVGSVYASMQALQGSNMETQIVFRSASPIAVSILEYIFLERELPGRGCGERYYSKRALPFGHSLFCFLPQSRGDRVLVSCFLTPGCMFCACLSSGLALAGILASALAYVATDSEFAVNGFAAYTWISLYFVLICVSMTLGKHLMATTKVSVWGSVLLTNGPACLPTDSVCLSLSCYLFLAFYCVRRALK